MPFSYICVCVCVSQLVAVHAQKTWLFLKVMFDFLPSMAANFPNFACRHH